VDQIYNVAKVGDHPPIHPSEDLAKFGYKLDMKVFNFFSSKFPSLFFFLAT
jgi:hypothetical protein